MQIKATFPCSQTNAINFPAGQQIFPEMAEESHTARVGHHENSWTTMFKECV